MESLRFLVYSSSIALFLVLSSQTSAIAAEPIMVGERSVVGSKILDEERQLMIALPRGYASSGSSYPVIYLLDPNNRFHHTSATAAELARIGQIPEMIVVGIVNTDRTRDLTPELLHPVAEKDEQAPAEQGGGADKFLDFIQQELIPHVEASYRTAPFRVLIGHSFGGLLAIHALVERPELFQSLLAISPSLWWDKGSSVDRTRAFLRGNPDLRNRLFVTLGDEGGEMLAQVKAMEDVLRYLAPAGLEWKLRYLGTENHGSVPIPSVHYGLKALFSRWQVPPFLMNQGLEGVERHYGALSVDMGYTVKVPEQLFNRLGYRALGDKDFDKAISIFKANADRFPDSANVYDSLAEAHEAAGNLERARDLYSKAFRLASKSNDPARSAFQEHLKAVKEKLASSH